MSPLKADAKAALRDRARVVAWGFAIVTVAQGVGAYLAQNHTGAVIAQVAIAEFGTGRLGVAWSDPLAALPSGMDMTKRALRGAGFGASAAAILVGASILAHAAAISAIELELAPLIVGLLVSVCAAARDELLLRGLVIRALGPRASVPVQLFVCGLAGLAFRFGTQADAKWPALAFAFLSAVAFACLWLRDRGAWLAVGANAAFMFLTGPVSHGAILDVRGAVPLDATIVACVCGVFFAGSAISYARGKLSSIGGS